MADRPPLSPGAQKVLGAMHRSYDHEPTRRLIAAAVLRAAADLTEADSIWHGYQEHTGVRWSAHQMRHYADELEGRHG